MPGELNTDLAINIKDWLYTTVPYELLCPRMKLSKFWRHFIQTVRQIWQYPFLAQNVVVFLTCFVFQISAKFIDHDLKHVKYKRLKWHMYGTIFALSRNVVHACATCGFTKVQSYTDQDMSSLSDPSLAHCCCCFVSQKLHLYTSVFFTIARTKSLMLKCNFWLTKQQQQWRLSSKQIRQWRHILVSITLNPRNTTRVNDIFWAKVGKMVPYICHFKACQMGHFVVSLWCARVHLDPYQPSANTRFCSLYFRMNNC